MHHAGHGHDGHVGAGTHDGRHTDGQEVVGRWLRTLHAVEQSVLDEHDGVRVLDRRPEQPVGVGRRRRHDHREPGDVGEEGFEALRVLAARRATGPELGADGERHLGGATGHERELGRLVEQLVEAHAEEVEVHHLDHRAHPGHRRPHAEADDGRLGDRRVTDAPGELVGQPAHEAEHVASGADIDPRDEHATVGRQLGLEGRTDRVHGAEHRCIRRGRGRLGATRAGPRHEAGQRADGRARRAREPSRPPHRARRPRRPRGRRARRRSRLRRPARARAARAGRWPSTPRAPPASGSARGRPRSARASGRSSPPPPSGPARHEPPQRRLPSPPPTAWTSLPSTATCGMPYPAARWSRVAPCCSEAGENSA